MNFVPRERSSFDEPSGVAILRPRVIPGHPSQRGDEVEYEYTFLRGQERVGWLGCTGTWETYGTGDQFHSIYTLDLGTPGVLEDLIRFKKKIANSEDMDVFLGAIAHGLVNAFAGQTDNVYQARYLAVLSEDCLKAMSIEIPCGAQAISDGRFALADVTVQAHPSTDGFHGCFSADPAAGGDAR